MIQLFMIFTKLNLMYSRLPRKSENRGPRVMKVSFYHLIYNDTIVKNGLSNHFLSVEDKQTKEQTNKQTFLEDKYKVSIFLYAEYNLC